jgi:hypothetical protein
MNKAELLLEARECSHVASLTADRLLTKVIGNGSRIGSDELRDLEIIRKRMQAALCATAKLEELARGATEPNEWDV